MCKEVPRTDFAQQSTSRREIKKFAPTPRSGAAESEDSVYDLTANPQEQRAGRYTPQEPCRRESSEQQFEEDKSDTSD